MSVKGSRCEAAFFCFINFKFSDTNLMLIRWFCVYIFLIFVMKYN